MKPINKKLLEHLRQDIDFIKFEPILEEVVESIDINEYLLQSRYLDYSYVVIDNLIIDLDSIYFLCKEFNS
tara:strand:+ start:1018 stop:1230 length:213 start_codon:yes stop_codon:yes gene_type:complete